MVSKTKITVVIVTFNGSKWLNKMLQGVLNSSIAVNVLVVDNASTDDSVAVIEKFSEVQLIKSATNLGFGKANNLGIKMALDQQSDFVFLLNQDTWIFKKSIETLVVSALQHPEIGILSPMHLCADENKLDSNFKVYYNRSCGTIGSEIIAVPFVNAAAWLVSAQCFKKVGLFEPLFNHYGEDRNFCDRVAYHGFKIGILKSTSIVHDRIIIKKFNKMVLQSKYKILNSFLNINTSFLQSSLVALSNVFGLPKYFFRDYTVFQIAHLFANLLYYFVKNILHCGVLFAIRNQSKIGKNGM